MYVHCFFHAMNFVWSVWMDCNMHIEDSKREQEKNIQLIKSEKNIQYRHGKSKRPSGGLLGRGDSKKALSNQSSSADAKNESRSHKINGTKANKAVEPKHAATQKHWRDRHSSDKSRPILEKRSGRSNRKAKAPTLPTRAPTERRTTRRS